MSSIAIPERRIVTDTDLRPFLEQVNKYVEIDGHAGIVDYAQEDNQEIRVAIISAATRLIFVHPK